MNLANALPFLAQVDTNSAAYDIGYNIGYMVGVVLMVIILLAVPILMVVSIVKFFKTKSAGWLVLAILCGLPLLAFVGLFGYGMYIGFTNVQNTIAEEQIEGKDRVVQVLESPLMLAIPDHWKMLNLMEGDPSLQMGNLYKEEYVMAYTNAKSDFFIDASQLSDNTIFELEANLGDAVVGERKEYQVNGMDVFETELSGEIDDLNIVYKCYILDGVENMYQVITWTLNSKRDSAMPNFDTMIRSAQEQSAATQAESGG